jgi:precorrin-2 dehydrogenase
VPVASPLYPVGLVVEARRCLVVGGGKVAARKAEGLAACRALVHVVAPAVGDAVQSLAAVTWEERPYRRGEVSDYRLAVAASNDPAVNRQVYEDGEKAGVWVNSADDPAACSFVLPSVARRGSLVLSVSTGGMSPALSSWLRDELADHLGAEHEAAAKLMAEERERRRGEGKSSEGLDWHGALRSDMLDLLRSGRVDEAREQLRSCLSSS